MLSVVDLMFIVLELLLFFLVELLWHALVFEREIVLLCLILFLFFVWHQLCKLLGELLVIVHGFIFSLHVRGEKVLFQLLDLLVDVFNHIFDMLGVVGDILPTEL